MEDCWCIFAAFVIHLKKSSCFSLYYRLYYSLHYSCCLSHSPQVISALSQELHLSTLSKYLYSFVDASLCHPSFFSPAVQLKLAPRWTTIGKCCLQQPSITTCSTSSVTFAFKKIQKIQISSHSKSDRVIKEVRLCSDCCVMLKDGGCKDAAFVCVYALPLYSSLSRQIELYLPS